MALQFSDHGPEFPSALVDALMAGEVVFLCGTGISAPQLPEFKSLVDRTYEQLGIEMDAAEKRSYDGQRFEEVLGTLGRRLADPEAMVRAASELLAVPADPRLDQHRTILRLSRDLIPEARGFDSAGDSHFSEGVIHSFRGGEDHHG